MVFVSVFCGGIFVAEQTVGGLILFDGGEAAQRIQEVVVVGIVIDHGDFADQDGTLAVFGDDELMVVAGVQGNAVAGLQHDSGAGGYKVTAAVLEHFHIGVGQLAVFHGGGVVHGEVDVIAAAVDQVFHLGVVVVHGGNLTGVTHDELFGVSLGVLGVVDVAVTDGDQSQTQMLEVAFAVVGHVPAQHVVTDLIIFVTLGFPLFGGEVQVRKDLSSISCGGKPKIGYAIKNLIEELETYLGLSEENGAVIVGVGRLGQALMEYEGFAQFGLKIDAGFDVRKDLFGTEIGGKPVYDESTLVDYVKKKGTLMAIITVPASFAQATADKLIQAGIKAIWNFSPTHIVVPETVVVKNENLATSLAVLSNQLKEKNKF